MRGMILGLLVMAGGIGNSATAVAEEVYKWVDKDGKVHYGEFDPGNRNVETIEMPDAPPPSTDPASTADERRDKQNKMIEQMNEDRIKKSEAKEKAAKDKQDAQQRCNQWKSQLATLRDSGRIYQVQPDGERRYLSDAERQKELANAESQVKRWCK